MGLFNKIKDILFVDEESELPVIDKKEEVKQEEKVNRQSLSNFLESDEDIIPKEVPRKTSPFVAFDEDEFDKVNRTVERDVPRRETGLRSEQNVDMYSRENNNRETVNREVTRETLIREALVKREPLNRRESTFNESYSRPSHPQPSKPKYDYKKLDIKKSVDKTPFKPSPVVSPVYGVLNKNYKEEEIVERKNPSLNVRNVDKVMDKALGIVEDTPVIVEEEVITRTHIPDTSIDDLILDGFNETVVDNEIFGNIKENNDNNKDSVVIEDFTSELVDEHTSALEILDDIEKELSKQNTDSSEGDLFNLIDSMYENRKDEE